jgi:hypothetical protein
MSKRYDQIVNRAEQYVGVYTSRCMQVDRSINHQRDKAVNAICTSLASLRAALYVE